MKVETETREDRENLHHLRSSIAIVPVHSLKTDGHSLFFLKNKKLKTSKSGQFATLSIF